MNEQLVYVIPMAGLGTRFRKAGYEQPKYMLRVRGATVFEHALRSLPLAPASKLVFVALREHRLEHALEAFIESALKRLPYGLPAGLKLEIIFIDGPTSGQAETVLKAGDSVPPGAELAIYNIDTHFRSSSLTARLASAERKDGIIGAFTLRERDPKWSFAAVGPDGEVTATAEKEQISDNALTGFYHFTRAEDFFRAARLAAAAGEMTRGELYVAPLYNRLIAEGKRFVLDTAETIVPLGTPEDLLKADLRDF